VKNWEAGQIGPKPNRPQSVFCVHIFSTDYENFEKGIMIYIKILKKGGVVEKRGRRKRNPCPMRL
jgi:hypothetical protein